MKAALSAPPYEFAPYKSFKKISFPLVLIALQLKHPEPLTWTETSLAVVAPHVLLLLLRDATL
jgi:hypothetical protein